MRDKEWIEVMESHMEEFKVPQEKVDRFWADLDYLDSGEVKRHDERNDEEEAKFQEAYNYVNDMVYYLDDMNTKKNLEEMESLLKFKKALWEGTLS